MHIMEGALSWPVLATGAAGSAVGVAYGLRKMEYEKIPMVGMLTSAFFVASLIHLPIGPSSAHLVLNGLLGLMLGPIVFPAVLISLTLQALFFGYGGITTLGVNTMNLALPALLCHYLFRALLLKKGRGWAMLLGVLTGFVSLGLSSLMVSACLINSDSNFTGAACLLLTTHLPLMAIEGIITGLVVIYLKEVKPSVFKTLLTPAFNLRASKCLKPTAGTILVCVFALAGSNAHAHRFNCFASYQGDTIRGEAYFSKGVKAHKATVKVLSDGKEIATLKTNDKGEFSYKPNSEGNFMFVVDSGGGHIAKYEVKSVSAGRTSAKVKAKAASNASSRIETASSRMAVDITADQIRRIVAEEMSAQLYPLKRQIDQQQNKIRFRDVIGGLGYIVGILGVMAYYMSRTCGKSGENS